MTYHGHIDRAALEKALRNSFATLQIPEGTPDEALCQIRGSEAIIQFNLWMADELNAGTPGSTLGDGASRLIGSMVQALAERFAGNTEVIDQILSVVIWQAKSGSADIEAFVDVPTTPVGRA